MKKSSGIKANVKNDGVAKSRKSSVLDGAIEEQEGCKTQKYLCV